MSKKTPDNPKPEKQAVSKRKTATKNRDEKGKFVKGNKPQTGFHTNPENINTTGENKGSSWKKNLLKELLAMPLTEFDMLQFEWLRERFPSFFKDTKEKNFQFFLELRQISLIFHGNGQVSQNAIKEIKDRIDGKVTQINENFNTHQVQSTDELVSWLDQFKLEDRTIEEIEEM